MDEGRRGQSENGQVYINQWGHWREALENTPTFGDHNNVKPSDLSQKSLRLVQGGVLYWRDNWVINFVSEAHYQINIVALQS